VGAPLRLPRPHRQQRLGPVQRLDRECQEFRVRPVG
jgi:hypothetical protein